MDANELMYLAQPYTGTIQVKEKRYQEGLIAAANCFKVGFFVFAPIVHCHTMHELCGLPEGFDFWRDYDEIMLARCQQLWILPLEGWRSSVGVAGEIKAAGALRLPIKVIVDHSPHKIDLIAYEAAVRDTAALP